MNPSQRIFERLVDFYKPANAVAISIDGWFGDKWLGFSGKVLGALGIRKLRLTVPPFVPNRVLSEAQYECLNRKILPVISQQKLHGFRTSQQNQNIYLDRLFKDAVLFWHGNSSERIPIMTYRITPEDSFGWYASILEKDNKIDFVSGISRSEAETILQINTAEQGAAANR